jgi:hypothetical protein
MFVGCGRIGFGAAVDGGDTASEPGDGGFDAPAGSLTVTFGEAPGTTFSNVTRDTYISNESGETGFNYGGDDEVRIERDAGERALIAFDVSALPPGSSVVNATLRVTIIELPPSPAPIDVHVVTESWSEGSLAGAPGVSNYLVRQGASSWTTAGCGLPGSAGAAVTAMSATGLGQTTVSLPVPIVQQWVTQPASNNGVVLIARSDDSTRFTTSEGTPAANRPVLTVVYLP